ncbi:vitamin D3 hydroxylase-associated protein-like isoform X1 [Haliotis rubra]|uniref:vitamin D3 hydroxylase-associated protein-like isoform X1 n=2 Tax=Haliotis rubra TaxID=36100 RepID=UPI001EE63143|nr:vitamin D3 hydroxylase-associated protein-like isoform X1 [Haliotis rubra]
MFWIPDDVTRWVKMQLPWFIDEWDSLFWQKVAGFATSVCLGWYIFHRVVRNKKLHDRIQQKQNEVRKSCQDLVERLRTEGLTVPHRERILSLSLAELQAQLQSGQLKCMEVLRAYQSKAMEMNEKLNCVVEPLMEAEEQAAKLDRQRSKKGPLHGVPISIKEAFYVKGYDCTAGMQHFIHKPLDHDAPYIQVLKSQGAIPFVRTNIPQTMMTFDSSNPIYGETLNPHDLSRSPGGSSSGEGALIASGGSCLGLGSDIGGSIRIPSHMCGVCGLKPTVERLGSSGMFPLGSGQTLVQVAAGPMAKDVDSLMMCMKALLVPALSNAWPLVQIVPFDTEIYESRKSLRIGYFKSNGFLEPVPAVERGVDMAVVALKKRGHTVVKFEPPRVRYMFNDLFTKAVFGDGGAEANSYLDNDVLDPSCRLSYYVLKIPYLVKLPLSLLVQLIDADAAETIKLKQETVPQWFKLAEDIEAYKLEFLAAMTKQKLDVILSPTMALPAIPLGKAAESTAAVTYTTLYNVLNFPAGSLPVTKVTEDDQKKLEEVYPTNTIHEKMTKKMSRGSDGLPVSVQCAARPFQEELVLRVMKDIEQEVKYK